MPARRERAAGTSAHVLITSDVPCSVACFLSGRKAPKRRAQAAAAPRRSSVPMALDVGKSLSEASLSQKAKCYGRWDYTDVRTDCPELADSMHWLLEAEEAKPSLKGMESLARSGRGCLVAGITQRGLSYCREASSAPTSRFPRVPLAPASRAARGGDSHPHLSHRFLSSDEQQTKMVGCLEPASSAPNAQSSAEESSIADVSHDISTSQCSQRPPSPSSSTLESLPQPTPLSPSRSRSRSSFSTLSLEENSASEQQEVKQSPGSPAGLDVPPAATAAWDLRRRPGVTEGKAPRAREPLAPLLDDHVTVGRVRKMSSYQADYWACAIPDSLPPSPDRQSPHWNPNKEYEDLLDYAYPLRPRTSRQDHQTPPPYGDSKSERSPFRAAGSRHQRESTEGFLGLCQPYSSQKPSWESTGSCSQVDRDPLSRLHLPADVRGTLDGTCPSELGAKGHPKEKGQQGESLAQCIKMFCCQLEELICWLYDVAALTDSWIPPMPDAASVKAALRRYLEFRKDVADHQSLTESVLQRGEALLECMASNSPALKETLGLIAKQSEELESHAERLYKSILAAVGPVQGEDREQDDSTRQAAAQWVLPPSDLGFVGCSQDG